ncbi:MAG: bifunctional 4-hydroxy-2-oxoglutarate aldolase/2-dehydro-3-deoxy-phosphogluconate aldolase [Firmicutes bacterium]|uniref:2-dehydro-3-deoxyphosphogluconate aldolase / (4S)-4-hydroxy-2-oxoglutarate aldolase n=1 Tax=Melghirimyces thermohalophilus TaxID=1236220 RepID=A0A1G6NAC8_9BACL|nr:bifunctional 4-hydroxy-2-oxoglutarate aldolase/2-dehydro-3-deoxy-phosphogluconate aldolase [Melghirimyces thermohalophilus]MDA8352407.1 bifunctional 4-hydroxy-2-oxoglutarate aldolase/2-dehydro-3-deoxy-phosphogluconate aldolase [Bacillota bacterium]SDC64337.1 2-dehydro-3-deoxyphosphogluconate aldolase / (4S)-4-hydroxy-2-oxoglutarate aldolase [Melghirimyces thermohalophilus]
MEKPRLETGGRDGGRMVKTLTDKIREEKIIAILRGVPRNKVGDVARALTEGGVRLIEVTLNTPEAEEAIQDLRALELPGVSVGAGTVMTPEAAERAQTAGAEYLITPHMDPEVIRYGVDHRLPVIAGAFTPTEVAQADRAGAALVKVFPARAAGPSYFKDLKGPLPQVPLVAVGGIDADNAASYIRSGAVAVGVGSSLVRREDWQEGEYQHIVEKARGFRRALDH